jgi:hypothetical protein
VGYKNSSDKAVKLGGCGCVPHPQRHTPAIRTGNHLNISGMLARIKAKIRS